MGKSTRWFLSLIGLKKSPKTEKPPATITTSKSEPARKSTKEKRRWSFGKSASAPEHAKFSEYDGRNSTTGFDQESTKHAIAVAAASAAAAEAAVAAAQAAAAVVRLTGAASRNPMYELIISREEWAATQIQTAFRGYLARRALRALKAVVRIQALFRGHRVRKQAALTLRCMQALVRVQARVRARRVRMSEQGQAVQQQLMWRRQQQQQPYGRSRKSVDGWITSTATVEDIQAKDEQRQLGAMKRERALAYALSKQMGAANSNSMVIDCEPDTPHWGWSWLDRWMAARPWESPFLDVNGNANGNIIPEASPLSEGSTKIVEIDANTLKRRPSKKRSGSASESLAMETNDLHHHFHPSPLLNNNSNSNSNSNSNNNNSNSNNNNNNSSSNNIHINNSSSKDCYDNFLDNYDNVDGYDDEMMMLIKSSPLLHGLKSTNNSNSNSKMTTDEDDLLCAFPNYMATTQSAKAKVRSHSTPKQRISGGGGGVGGGDVGGVETPRKRQSIESCLRSTSTSRRNPSWNHLSNSSLSHMRLSGRSGSVVLERSLISLKDGQTTMSVNGDLRKPFRF